MKMSFESWVKNSWLERLQSDAEEIARLLALADGRSCSGFQLAIVQLQILESRRQQSA
jgi:hypothetical protein